MPNAALDVLDGMLVLDPTKRLATQAILNSPWLRDINPDEIPPPKLDCIAFIFNCVLCFVWMVGVNNYFVQRLGKQKQYLKQRS